MKRYILSLSCSLFILSVLLFRFCSDLKTFRSSETLLLPVRIKEIKTNSFSSVALLRYYNIIPVEEMLKESGVIVVKRSDDGKVSFVSVFTGQELHPKEFLLKYTVVPPSPLYQERWRLNIRFAATKFPFSRNPSLLLTNAYYAMIHVNDDGDALLVGLTDSTGTQTVKNLML